jgi:hypothetical protein
MQKKRLHFIHLRKLNRHTIRRVPADHGRCLTTHCKMHCTCYSCPLYRRLRTWMPPGVRYCRKCERFTWREKKNEGRCKRSLLNYNPSPPPQKRKKIFNAPQSSLSAVPTSLTAIDNDKENNTLTTTGLHHPKPKRRRPRTHFWTHRKGRGG